MGLIRLGVAVQAKSHADAASGFLVESYGKPSEHRRYLGLAKGHLEHALAKVYEALGEEPPCCQNIESGQCDHAPEEEGVFQ